MFKDSPEGQTQYEPAAPEPVAWMGEYHTNDIRDHYTVVMRHKTDFDGVPDRVQPLYSAATVERLVQECNGWIDSAKHFSNGMEYYRDQLDACARHIGLPCFTADDGGVHEEPLRAKVAECVGELQEQLAASQAREQQLREAVRQNHQFRLMTDPSKHGDMSKGFYYGSGACVMNEQVLSLPQDDTALRQWGAKLVRDWLADYMYGNGAETLEHYLNRKADELEGKKHSPEDDIERARRLV